MKTITLSHYTMKDIDPTPWRQTWDNLVHFASRMAPKLAPLGFQLKLRKVELEEPTQDNLMSVLELDFTPCAECRTPEGQEFPCRTFTSFGGEVCQALPEEFFMEAALRVAFKSQHECTCHCGDCGSGSCGGCADGEHEGGHEDGEAGHNH